MEVREMILEYCLCVEGDIVPFPTHYEGKGYDSPAEPKTTLGWKEAAEVPTVALLSVTKNIREEGLRILLSKNVWRLSYLYDPIDSKDHERKFWENYIHLFRYITTQFDMGDASQRCLRQITQDWMEPELLNVLGFSEEQRTSLIHDGRIRCLIVTWQWKQRLMEKMKLNKLVLGFENLFCPSGCCRSEVLDQFFFVMGQQGPWYRLEPGSWSGLVRPITVDIKEKCKTKIEVKGLRDVEEQKLIYERWGLQVEQSSTDQ
jgi:hypothetical protein